jgi:alkylation response protein AidB-like acyl-CoA dehydrogenase
VDAVLTEEQVAIAEAARGLAEGGLAAARTVLDGGEIPAQPTAALFEGFGGLGIPEEAGGAGGTLVDLALVARELGRTVVPTPWLAHQMAVHAAAAAGFDLAEGLDPAARWVLVDDDSAGDGPDGGTLVRHGLGATAAVVVDGDAVELRAVGPGAIPRRAMDPTRPIAEVTLGPRIAAGDGGRDALRRARAVLAASLTGTGLGAVERAAAYALQREQFGRPVAVFQAVQHQLADAWTAVELAWSLALYACWAVGEGGGAGDPAAIDRAVDAAVAKAGSSAIFAAERGMQVHGGIGITWEADPHLALRRAVGDDVWLGGARQAELALGRALLAG